MKTIGEIESGMEKKLIIGSILVFLALVCWQFYTHRNYEIKLKTAPVYPDEIPVQTQDGKG